MINFPIFIRYENGETIAYRSYNEIEKKCCCFLSKDGKGEVFDSKGQKLILNVFLNEVQDLYPEKE
jgi:hypothetical protein